MKQYNLFLYLAIAVGRLAGAAPTVDLQDAQSTSDLFITADHALLEARQVRTADCRPRLSCSYEQIEAQPMDWRLDLFEQVNYAGGLPAYADEIRAKLPSFDGFEKVKN